MSNITGVVVLVLLIVVLSDSIPICQSHESEDPDVFDSPNDQQIVPVMVNIFLIPRDQARPSKTKT